MSNSPVELEIVIPVYNEGENITATLKSLYQSVKTPSKILICYDFEEDNTLPVARGLVDPRFPLEFVRNKGKGPLGAILTGINSGTAPAVIVLPADDCENAVILDQMVEKFKNGAEIVSASRFMRGGTMEGCPLLKATLVRGASFLLYYVGRLPVHDASNGFRLFSRKLLQRVQIESEVGFAYSIELLVKCHRLRLKMDEVPSRWREREHGQSRFKVLRWLPQYLRWFFYGLETTYLRRGPETVK